MKIKKHFINNWVIYLFGIIFICFDILYPNLEITISGGFAWLTLFLSWLIGFTLVMVCIMGGSISYESKGLRGWIKEYLQTKQETKREIDKIKEQLKQSKKAFPESKYSEAFTDKNIKSYVKEQLKIKRLR